MNIDDNYVRASVARLFASTGADRFFDQPIVGLAAAEDPLFASFKAVIGEHHWTPEEALRKDFPEAAARSVIAWVLPLREEARAGNRAEASGPSLEWAQARSFGELANEQMRSQLSRVLTELGYPASAPHLTQRKLGYHYRELGFSSHWSERHAAFAAGLGTFSLSASLISRAGSAIRIGTVVTSLSLPADEREYGEDPYAWCTMCGECAARCPARAVGPEPADRDKAGCDGHLTREIPRDRIARFGWLDLELGCGLCQTGVPCESKRP